MSWLQERRQVVAEREAAEAYAMTGGAISGGRFFEGASVGRRFIGMSAPRSGPNTPILASGDLLTDRSFHFARNEAFIRRGLNALSAGIIGNGVIPQSELDDMPELQEAIHELWDATMNEVDADGMTDGYGLMVLGCRGVLTGGDSFPRFRPRLAADRAPYMPVPFAVPLQIQMHGAEMVPRWKNEDLGKRGRIIGGIEVGPFGNRVAVHMYRDHPSDWAVPGAASGELVRVPAEEVMHIHEISREGQLRGEPRCASILLPTHDFHQGEDVLQKQWNLGALFSGFIEYSGELPLLNEGDQTKAQQGVMPVTMHPGDVMALKPGQKFSRLAPPEVGVTYEPATRLRLRRMAAGLGVPYEILAMDMAAVTYSSARIGLLEFWAECDQFLWQTIIPQFLRPFWIRWLDVAIMAGKLPLTRTAYLANPRKYLDAVTWIPPKRPWIDPLKDVQGELLAIKGGLISRDESILSRGGIPARVDRARRRSMLRAHSLELTDGEAPAAVIPVPDEPPQPQPQPAPAPRDRKAA